MNFFVAQLHGAIPAAGRNLSASEMFEMRWLRRFAHKPWVAATNCISGLGVAKGRTFSQGHSEFLKILKQGNRTVTAEAMLFSFAGYVTPCVNGDGMEKGGKRGIGETAGARRGGSAESRSGIVVCGVQGSSLIH